MKKQIYLYIFLLSLVGSMNAESVLLKKTQQKTNKSYSAKKYLCTALRVTSALVCAGSTLVYIGDSNQDAPWAYNLAVLSAAFLLLNNTKS